MNTKYFFLVIAALSLLLAVNGCGEKAAFLSLAESTISDAMKGKQTAENGIDWNGFTWNNEEIGRTYMGITQSSEKAAFRRNILSRLSADLNSRGWDQETVQNWRVTSQGVESSIAVADVPGGTVTVFMQKVDGEKRIRRIQY